jgi:hypothetical protein
MRFAVTFLFLTSLLMGSTSLQGCSSKKEEKDKTHKGSEDSNVISFGDTVPAEESQQNVRGKKDH